MERHQIPTGRKVVAQGWVIIPTDADTLLVRITAAQVLGKVIQEEAVPPPTLLTGPFVTVITEV